MKTIKVGAFTVRVANRLLDIPELIEDGDGEQWVPNCAIQVTDRDYGLIHTVFCYVEGDYEDHPAVEQGYYPAVPGINREWLGERTIERLIGSDLLDECYEYTSIFLALNTVPTLTGFVNTTDYVMTVPGIFVGCQGHATLASRLPAVNTLRIYREGFDMPALLPLHTIFDQLPWESRGMMCLVVDDDSEQRMIETLQESCQEWLEEQLINLADPDAKITKLEITSRCL